MTYESDLYGSLEADRRAGADQSAPTTAADVTAAAAGPRSSDHPINPSIIGTPQDAQLSAALDYLKKASAQRGSGSGF